MPEKITFVCSTVSCRKRWPCLACSSVMQDGQIHLLALLSWEIQSVREREKERKREKICAYNTYGIYQVYMVPGVLNVFFFFYFWTLVCKEE